MKKKNSRRGLFFPKAPGFELKKIRLEKGLKQKGIIKRMAPELDLEKLGLPIFALIEVDVENPLYIEELEKKYAKSSKIVWSFKIVGNYDWLIGGYFDSPGEMEKLVNSLVNDPLVKNAYGNIVSQRKRFMMAPHPLKES